MEIAFFTVDQTNDISGITRKPLFVCCKIGFASLGTRKCVRVHKEIFTKITSGFSHLKQPGAGVSVLGKDLFS